MAGFADALNNINSDTSVQGPIVTPQVEEISGLDALNNINAEPGQPIVLPNSQPAGLAIQTQVPAGQIPNALLPNEALPKTPPIGVLTPEMLGANNGFIPANLPATPELDLAAPPESQPLESQGQQADPFNMPASTGIQQQIDSNNRLIAGVEKYTAERQRENDLFQKQMSDYTKVVQEDVNYFAKERQKLYDDSREKINRKVDPENFWNSRGTGTRLLGALSIALGEISKGFTGNFNQTNPALAIINDAIDRDVQAQEENYKRDVNSVNESYKIIADNYKDVATRRELYKNDIVEKYKTKINNLGTKYEGTKTAEGLKQLNAGITQQAEAAKQQQIKDYVVRQLVDGKSVGGEDPLNLSPSARAKIEAANPELKDKYVPSFGYATGSKEAIQKFQDENFDAKNIIRSASQLKDITKALSLGGRLNPYNIDKQLANSVSEQLVGNLRLSFTGPGILTEPEKETLRKIIGESGTVNLFTIDKARLARLDNLISNARQRAIDRATAAGINPGPLLRDSEKQVENIKQKYKQYKQ